MSRIFEVVPMIENMLQINVKSVTSLILIVLITAAIALSGCTEATGGSLMDDPGQYIGKDIGTVYQ